MLAGCVGDRGGSLRAIASGQLLSRQRQGAAAAVVRGKLSSADPRQVRGPPTVTAGLRERMSRSSG